MDAGGETPTVYLQLLQPIAGLQPFYPLSGSTVTVGRHPSNDINIPVEAISRFHARIEKQGDRFVVIDLNSSNGTYVDRQRVGRAILEPGCTVAFGNVEFRCEAPRPDAIPPTTQRLMKTPVEFVSADRKHSELVMEAKAGRDSTPIERFIEVPPDRENMAKAYRKLAALYQLSDLLHSAPKEDLLLDSFMDLIFEIVPADRGVILMREEGDGELQIRVSRTRDPREEKKPISISRTIIDRCMQERVAVLSQDALSDQRFKASKSVLLHEIRSTIVVPLVSQRSDILGVLHLDTRQSAHAFSNDDLNFVTSLANDLALFLDHKRMWDEHQHSQEMASVGEVITDLAHSIKNVLVLAEGGVKLTDRLIDHGDLERLRETWKVTQRTMVRISTMVKEMLEYSRAPRIQPTRANLNQLVQETCESFREQFESKGITVHSNLDPQIEDALLDAEGLVRCLINLLVNGCEAISHDHGEITVTTQMTPGRDLVLSIEDNGMGISPEKLRRVFFPRFSTKEGQGTGLGLAMVKKWVTATGGTVRVSSTEGQGTRFIITLPRIVTATTQDLEPGMPLGDEEPEP